MLTAFNRLRQSTFVLQFLHPQKDPIHPLSGRPAIPALPVTILS